MMWYQTSKQWNPVYRDVEDILTHLADYINKKRELVGMDPEEAIVHDSMVMTQVAFGCVIEAIECAQQMCIEKEDALQNIVDMVVDFLDEKETKRDKV